MNPAHRVEELLDGMAISNPRYTSEETANLIAKAQVYATLALANAIEGVGIDIKESLQMTNAELGAIAMGVLNER